MLFKQRKDPTLKSQKEILDTIKKERQQQIADARRLTHEAFMSLRQARELVPTDKHVISKVYLRGDEAFWTAFGNALRFNHSSLEAIGAFVDFLKAFSHNAWVENEKIVVLIAEFDLMHEASDNIRN
ncbi:hypothetical protein EDD21DRAFT_410784 [Dissophora ornata]|nr:hypothetical protein BGZ58_004945 [Dissophora ornata]KAI8605775.1 hypothetical protein EDD21DRAFT_410784 [Dissophora ornata]